MSLLRKQLTLITAFLAVMCAQAYGLEMGYASHHGISVIEVEFGGAPGQGLPGTPAEGQQVPENYAPITVDMEAGRSHVAALASLEFVPVELAEISVLDWILRQQAAESELLTKAAHDIFGVNSEPAALVVARCVVMLI